MAIYTQLSPTATPGRRYSFSAKTPESGGKGVGPFTSLSVSGVPGRIHTFSAKTPESGGKGAGLFTSLSVLGVPGQRHSFLAKTPFIPEPTRPQVISVGGSVGFEKWPEHEYKDNTAIWRDDQEILEIICSILPLIH